MRPDTEQVLNRTMNRQKPLRLPSGCEAAHLTFSLPRRLVRYFGSIVRVPRRVVRNGWHDIAARRAVEKWSNVVYGRRDLGGDFLFSVYELDSFDHLSEPRGAVETAPVPLGYSA